MSDTNKPEETNNAAPAASESTTPAAPEVASAPAEAPAEVPPTEAVAETAAEPVKEETPVAAEATAELAAAPATPTPAKKGEKRSGKVVAFVKDEVMVELGGKDQGICKLSQFETKPEVGHEETFTLSSFMKDENLWQLTREGKAASGNMELEQLQQGMIVEAKVTGMNTGGLELKVAGQRAFMPSSQVAVEQIDNFAPYLNRTLSCKIIELSSTKKKIILSHRAVEEKELKQANLKLLDDLKEGDIIEGKVKSIQKFGAFVEVAPGLDGLVHIADISYSRVKSVGDVLKKDQQVKVKLLKVNRESGKLSLGIKQVTPDPWDNIDSTYKVGEEISGRVARLSDFGAFVELADGVEGLIPLSEMSWSHVQKAEEVLEAGQTVKVKVMRVDAKKHRISLSLRALEEDPWAKVAEQFKEGDTVKGNVTRVESFGCFVELGENVEGMIHISNLDTRRINAVTDVVTVGKEVEAKVLEVDAKKRRIGLSRRALHEKDDPKKNKNTGSATRHDVKKHLNKQGSEHAGESLGSLLDKFGGDGGGLKGGLG